MNRFVRAGLVFAGVLSAWVAAQAAPTLNGSIGAEGWIHLTEDPYARPVLGGQTGSSDLTGETSAQYRWDGSQTVNLGSGRGNVHNLFVQWDGSFLYIAVEGPTAPFSSWSGPNGGSGNDDGDQGDLYVAFDIAGGAASGFLSANDAHRTFHDVNLPQAVDFEGWRPTHFIGVDWVQNSDFAAGQGYANLEVAQTHAVLAGEGHFVNDGGFAWAAGFDGSGRGVYEFAVPWAVLGLGGAPERDFRFAMYTTYNADHHDTYDSGPGIGAVTHHEQLGDFPGDRDTGTGDDGLGAGVGGQNGVPAGAFPGSNFVDPNTYSYGAAPNRGDEIDTIAEYLTIAVIPEPGTFAMLGLGFVGVLAARRFRRS